MKIAMRKRYKNTVGGVVHAAIQITVDSDLSAEQTAPPRSTHVQPGDVSHALIQQGERERLRKTPSSSTTAWWRWSSWFSGRASPSTTEEEEVLEEGGAAPGEGVRLPSLSLTIYRGKRLDEAP